MVKNFLEFIIYLTDDLQCDTEIWLTQPMNIHQVFNS